MEDQVLALWSDQLLQYNFGLQHPMSPLRLKFTHALLGSFGMLSHERIDWQAPPLASNEDLSRIHTEQYLEQVQAAAEGIPAPQVGLGTEDTPIFAEIHESSARIAGGSKYAAQQIMAGKYRRAVHFAGGLHHAMPKAAAGFCVYNDIALGIHAALDAGAKQVVYLDFDAHHGDGVQEMFWQDPRVITISVHESGITLFPGTGFANETGGVEAQGTAVNIALPAGSGDQQWLRAITAVVEPVLREVSPDMLVTQHGCDCHGLDPLTNLQVSVDAQRQAMVFARQWADEYCQGRWLALGGGGYAITEVVPRAWTHLVAVVADIDLSPAAQISPQWREKVLRAGFRSVPWWMTDRVSQSPYEENNLLQQMGSIDAGVDFEHWSEGFNPADQIDQAIMATRNSVFPFFGLDVYYD